MNNRELRELKNIKRELQKNRGTNEVSSAGNKLIAFILVSGGILIILIAIIFFLFYIYKIYLKFS